MALTWRINVANIHNAPGGGAVCNLAKVRSEFKPYIVESSIEESMGVYTLAIDHDFSELTEWKLTGRVSVIDECCVISKPISGNTQLPTYKASGGRHQVINTTRGKYIDIRCEKYETRIIVSINGGNYTIRVVKRVK